MGRTWGDADADAIHDRFAGPVNMSTGDMAYRARLNQHLKESLRLPQILNIHMMNAGYEGRMMHEDHDGNIRARFQCVFQPCQTAFAKLSVGGTGNRTVQHNTAQIFPFDHIVQRGLGVIVIPGIGKRLTDPRAIIMIATGQIEGNGQSRQD